MANFAKDQLQKYGWTEGKGLGKNEDGITKPLRPTLKFDTAGLGHIPSIQCLNYFWPKFMDTMSIVNMQKTQPDYKKINNIIYNDCKSNEDKIATEKCKNTQSKYKNFLKTSTLHNGNLIPEAKSKETEAVKEVSLSDSDRDEAILKVYDRNSRYRKTRYNPMSNAKLYRIAMQDEMLLNNNNNLSQLITNPAKKDIVIKEDIAITETKKDTITKEDAVTEKNADSDAESCVNEHKIHIDTNVPQTLTDYSKKRKMKELVRKLDNCSLKEDSGVGPMRNRRFYYMENKGNSFYQNAMKEFRTFHSLTPLGRMILENKRECDKKHEACKTIPEENTHNSDKAKDLDTIDIRLENRMDSTLRRGSYMSLCNNTKLIRNMRKMERRRRKHEKLYANNNGGTNDIHNEDKMYNFESECPPHLIGALHEALKNKSSRVSRYLNWNNLKSTTADGKVRKPSSRQRSVIIHELMDLANKMAKKNINDLVNSLTAVNLAKDVSAEIKKKPTQTHRTPV